MHIAQNTHGLWGATAIAAPVTQPLDRQLNADFVVIGAGFTGLSTALHLAEEGARSVVVLEASEIGYGASGRNAGLVNAGAWIAPEELPRRLGPVYGKRLFDTLGNGPEQVYGLIARHGIDCDPVRQGNLHCAVGASGLALIEERARQWRALGIPVELLDATQTAALVGSDRFTGALRDPRTGTIQPLSYVRGLARVATQLGVRIFTQTAVVGKHKQGDVWQLRTSTGHVVSTPQVVVASNTRQEGRDDAWPELQSDAIRMPYFNMATEPLSQALRSKILPQGQGAWDTATVLSSFRMDRAGRLVYGSVGSLADWSRGTHRDWVRRAMTRLYPELRDTRIEHAWHGYIDVTANHLPHLHQPDDNVWAFGGYNGRGIAAGTVLGRELARVLVGRMDAVDMSLAPSAIRPLPFKRTRELFYDAGAVAAHAVNARF
ncbi:NAD(P)/FAD-dependent oxidoreductase [Diaphorobacter caeni]|uniref:NAD(P)/FAD-dependent oxidoreductase n=1 Tax=Diaphorobacter caeni TaxID=2784387 RepID=UPI00188DF792|nr:FAD-binding oxidoreductase [Diaphorobacter caeni]MBF5004218.1 FAD-binding oxidoreductase [Diaphorobacter caeni]